MIVEYHRPKTLQEAIELLERSDPLTIPLAGGTVVNQPSQDPIAVVDLQALGLDTIKEEGNTLSFGAMATLQGLLVFDRLPATLGRAIGHEATYNLRQVATVAGTLVAADGRSPFTTVMLSLDAQLTLLPDEEVINLGDLLPLRGERLQGKLITQVSVPRNVALAYEYVARTPADLPIVCVGLAQWPSGRTRLALGGYGQAPLLAFDGPEAAGVETAASEAYIQAGDEWGSAEYRSEMAGLLIGRCLKSLDGGTPR
jgi:CO/xanthine dehydrogenase FAD-binding subunit